jgi:hypothetical protein
LFLRSAYYPGIRYPIKEGNVLHHILIILPLICIGEELLSLTVTKEDVLLVFVNRVLRRFDSKREKVIGQYMKTA